ncbi:UDP-N-acetylglucosamine--N-acetylmuramyl-(pentapeptide) pyrophosphoryl-undecaprenol N-acetylglucosamine transferase [Candidatus Leptofilum sp.]|uniref:UDP-N-acetylglucosamine--N-acetylmuramyl- (pentapeptide) pyrophosphoryl-undecaprenol N-acetylglucosamine transferase n=1 Tax=Candidatus Leptofilum sp. TaxID=3241576 RepID=UPI003B5A4A30
MRVLICAGGTGGGIYPALAAATALRNRGLPTENILWVGTKGEMEQTLVPRAGIKLETIVGGAIAGVPLHRKLVNGSKLLLSVSKARQIVRRFRPDVMFMTGGYMAFPFTLACRWLGVPITIYLPDVEPGQSIQFSLRYAEKVGATTDGSAQFVPADKLVVTGYPVRPELRAAANISLEDALASFDLQPGRPTLMVFGGSRGARAINRALMKILPELLQAVQIIHISGTFTWDEVDTNAKKLPKALREFYRPYPYLHDKMGHAFHAADLVVARAGASMLGESTAFGLPSILVPLAWAWRYQKVNADYLCERGTAVQLTDETLNEKLLPTIQSLLADPNKLAQMRQAARDLDVPNGAENLAALIESVAKTSGKE